MILVIARICAHAEGIHDVPIAKHDRAEIPKFRESPLQLLILFFRLPSTLRELACAIVILLRTLVHFPRRRCPSIRFDSIQFMFFFVFWIFGCGHLLFLRHLRICDKKLFCIFFNPPVFLTVRRERDQSNTPRDYKTTKEIHSSIFNPSKQNSKANSVHIRA